MNIGLGETIIIFITMALIVGILMVIIWVGILLFRRMNALESRIKEIESKQDKTQ
ncbi:MAG: hypothetical protein HZB50_06815 [Chloroflexi bacterium]|nr:hypothetical protein [Chloroflexota bacterium]